MNVCANLWIWSTGTRLGRPRKPNSTPNKVNSTKRWIHCRTIIHKARFGTYLLSFVFLFSVQSSCSLGHIRSLPCTSFSQPLPPPNLSLWVGARNITATICSRLPPYFLIDMISHHPSRTLETLFSTYTHTLLITPPLLLPLLDDYPGVCPPQQLLRVSVYLH